MNVFPQTVIIEPTNVCNLRCPLCSTFTAMKRPRGFMEFALFQQIISEFIHLNIRPEIALNMCGEPLLHPEIASFVEFAAQHGFKTFISTNVTRLTAELGERLIRGGLDAISLCLDGFSARSHEAYRVGSSFEQLKQNCETFISARQRLQKTTPMITIQTLLTSLSEPEMDAIQRWARETGADFVHFKTLSLGTHTSAAQKAKYAFLLPAQPELLRQQPPAHTDCMRPMTQTIIYWNGDVGLCCIDFNNEFNLGNVRNNSFAAIYQSDYAVKIRNGGMHREHPLCQQCQAAGNFPGFRIALREEAL